MPNKIKRKYSKDIKGVKLNDRKGEEAKWERKGARGEEGPRRGDWAFESFGLGVAMGGPKPGFRAPSLAARSQTRLQRRVPPAYLLTRTRLQQRETTGLDLESHLRYPGAPLRRRAHPGEVKPRAILQPATFQGQFSLGFEFLAARPV